MGKLFENVIGQESVKKRLTKIIESGNIPHAFLFSGQKGIGKFTFALEIIAYLNRLKGLNQKEIEQIRLLRKPYVEYIFPLPTGKSETKKDGPYSKLSESQIEEIHSEIEKKIANPYHRLTISKAQNIKISSIRELKKNLSVNKSEIPYSAIIIDDAEKMSVEAQNSLLKSLEEPPEGILFFLLVSDENLILDTIKSRSWFVSFPNLTPDEIKIILNRYSDSTNDVIEKIAPFVNGSVTKAFEILDYGDEIVDLTIEFIRQSIAGNIYSATKSFDSLMEITSNNLSFTIELVTMWLADANKNKLSGEISDSDFHFQAKKETFEKFNQNFPDVSLPQVIVRLNELSSLDKNNVSLKIILMNIIFVLNSLSRR